MSTLWHLRVEREDGHGRHAGEHGARRRAGLALRQRIGQRQRTRAESFQRNETHRTAQHSTAQHTTAQHTTAQYSTAQHSTAQHSTAQHTTGQREKGETCSTRVAKRHHKLQDCERTYHVLVNMQRLPEVISDIGYARDVWTRNDA